MARLQLDPARLAALDFDSAPRFAVFGASRPAAFYAEATRLPLYEPEDDEDDELEDGGERLVGYLDVPPDHWVMDGVLIPAADFAVRFEQVEGELYRPRTVYGRAFRCVDGLETAEGGQMAPGSVVVRWEGGDTEPMAFDEFARRCTRVGEDGRQLIGCRLSLFDQARSLVLLGDAPAGVERHLADIETLIGVARTHYGDNAQALADADMAGFALVHRDELVRQAAEGNPAPVAVPVPGVAPERVAEVLVDAMRASGATFDALGERANWQQLSRHPQANSPMFPLLARVFQPYTQTPAGEVRMVCANGRGNPEAPDYVERVIAYLGGAAQLRFRGEQEVPGMAMRFAVSHYELDGVGALVVEDRVGRAVYLFPAAPAPVQELAPVAEVIADAAAAPVDAQAELDATEGAEAQQRAIFGDDEEGPAVVP